MLDVTQEVLRCREAIRHLWNTQFLGLLGRLSEAEAIDLFEQAVEVIFDASVLHALRIEGFAANLNREPFTSLVVVPEELVVGRVLVNRSSPSSAYWDEPLPNASPVGVKLEFMGFFDWDQFAQIDLRFFRTRIAAFPDHPILIGRDALVDVAHARIFAIRSE
jgi:hypothetical protein